MIVLMDEDPMVRGRAAPPMRRTRPKRDPLTTALASAGVLGGILCASLAVFPLNRTGEVVSNRLLTPALVGMLMGFVALLAVVRVPVKGPARIGMISLLAGLVLMICGNVAEYWFLYDLPHDGRQGFIRGIAFMTFLLGWLVLLVGLALVGVGLVREGRSDVTLGVLLLSALPLTIAIGFVDPKWTGMPIAALSILVSGISLRESSRSTVTWS